jgi:hypothetical protein
MRLSDLSFLPNDAYSLPTGNNMRIENIIMEENLDPVRMPV